MRPGQSFLGTSPRPLTHYEERTRVILPVAFLLLVWGITFLGMLVGTMAVIRHARGRLPSVEGSFSFYPVSILKPLKGCEDGTEGNLTTFFALDYPKYELIFSITDPGDPVRPLVERLIRRHPDIAARLVVADARIGLNPKINNMALSYRLARHDLILISDSNARAEPDLLQHLVCHLEEGVGVITAAIAGRNYSGFAGNLEANYLNTFLIRWMHVGDILKKPLVMGKCMFFKRATLERFGGIHYLSRFIAEDYSTGRSVEKLKLRIVLMNSLVTQHLGHYSFKSFWHRHIRWGRIRKSCAPVAFLLEINSSALFSAFVGASAFRLGFGFPFWIFFGAHLAIWLVCDSAVRWRVERRLTVSMLFFWFVSEILTLPLWCVSAAGSTIEWRGNRLRLKQGGVLSA